MEILESLFHIVDNVIRFKDNFIISAMMVIAYPIQFLLYWPNLDFLAVRCQQDVNLNKLLSVPSKIYKRNKSIQCLIVLVSVGYIQNSSSMAK